MPRAFVLIDALPRREQDVLDALGKFPHVVAKRRLPQRAGQGDVIALIEAADAQELETIITSRLRGVAGAHTIIRLRPHSTIMGPVIQLMDEMTAEADARGDGKVKP